MIFSSFARGFRAALHRALSGSLTVDAKRNLTHHLLYLYSLRFDFCVSAFFFALFFFFAFSPLLLPLAVNPPLTELGFEDMSHTNNTIQQAHHKKEEVHFSDMNGARAVGVNNLPKLCWPEGEAPAAHPEQLQLQPHYPATTVSVAADAGAPLDVPTPPTDGVFARADIHSHMIPSL